MLSHKLILDDAEYQNFKLIAIHCSVEEYRLAYLLNKHLDLKLSRARNDIDYQTSTGHAVFGLYKYEDQHKYCEYYLISNKFRGETTTTGFGSLFGEEETASTTAHFLPEFSKVDFFLKLEEESDFISETLILDRIKQIPPVATAYSIKPDQIKSKENLIFD